jgi:hypothetical protein
MGKVSGFEMTKAIIEKAQTWTNEQLQITLDMKESPELTLITGLWLTTAGIRRVDSYTQQHGSTKSQYINLYWWFENKWFDTKLMFDACSSEWFEKKSVSPNTIGTC